MVLALHDLKTHRTGGALDDLGGGLNIFPRNLVMNGTIQANSNMIALSFDTASDAGFRLARTIR